MSKTVRGSQALKTNTIARNKERRVKGVVVGRVKSEMDLGELEAWCAQMLTKTSGMSQADCCRAFKMTPEEHDALMNRTFGEDNREEEVA